MKGAQALSSDSGPAALTLVHLAARLRAAIMPDQPVVDICRQVADELMRLATRPSGGLDASAQTAMIDTFRKRFSLPSRQSGRLLLDLTRQPDHVFGRDELNHMLGVRSSYSQVRKVYVCNLRAALADLGLEDVLQNDWGRGYYIRSVDVGRILQLWQAL